MNGEAENTNPQTHQPQTLSLQNRRRSGGATVDCFPVGSSVEVRTDEEGFKFVHFAATVISPPAPSKSPKKGSKKKSAKKSGKEKSICVEVEYHNLLANNELDRLSESVDISCLRPVPPLQETTKGFEVGDVVDAYYRDGWWQGVVSQVAEGGVRFVVAFQDPPDVLEFGLEDLRFHWDWDNGSWVRPQKQNMTGLMFDVGRKVEVSFDREDSQDAWFPATIQDDLRNGVFRVEYTDKKGEAVIATVDSLHVRPCPPLLKDKNFVLLEKVDAFFDYCWWSGVITKELLNSRYVVFFKPMKQDMEIDQSKLRPHMDWKDGKWFTSSQEASIQPSDGKVHEHHLPENPSAMVATAPAKNSGDGKSPRDGKTATSLNTSKGQAEKLTPDNQKASHMTKSLKKRRQPLTDPGTTNAQPPKKPKEGNVVVTKPKDRKEGNGQVKEVLCGLVSPDSASNTDSSAIQTTEDQPSFDHPWDKKIQRKQRNIRSKQNSSGMITSPPSSLKNCTTTLFESQSLDIRGEALGSAEKYLEDAQNDRANEGLEVPIIIGLPCFEAGSPGVSGGRKSQSFKIKDVATIVNDKEHPLINSSNQKIKDNTQSGTRESSERRKRGRPKRAFVESTQVSGNAQNGDVDSGASGKKDDLQKSPQVEEEIEEIEGMIPDLNKTDVSQEKVADGLSYPKNKRVRTMKRTSPSVHKEKGKESVELGENLQSKKKGKKTTAIEVQDSLDASRETTMEVDHTVDVPSTEFDNEPLSKWIVELNSPLVIDSSRRSPDTLDHCRVNGEKQRDGAEINEGSEKQLKSGKQPSSSVDKNSTKNSEKQPETGSQALALVDKDLRETSDMQSKQSLPFVKNISLWKTIESMEVFQKIPQNPHFRPLEQVEESSYRESLAIGLMVAFASLVETTSKLQVSDPKSMVDDMIATVEKLDKHGFDVGVLQDHISEFLEVKDKEEKLVEEVNRLKDQIVNRNNENTRIEEEMLEINEQIRKLQEKHSVAQSAKVKIADEVASLKVLLEKTEGSIGNLRRNFKGAVSVNVP